MKKLAVMLTGNLGWKLMSLVTAVAMWFFVVNITNPTQEWSYQVQLKVLGEDNLEENNTLLLNASELKATFVTMRVRASVGTLRQMNVGDMLNAYIDLNPIDIVHTLELGQNLPVRVKYESMGNGYEVVRVTPEEVNVVIDKYITRGFAVDVEKTDEDSEGYITMEPQTDVKMVTLSGPKSIIDTVAQVKAFVQVSGETETFTVTQPLIAVDGNGNNVSAKLEMSVRTATVTIPVDKYAKIPVSLPDTVGEPAAGYRVISRNRDPAYIEVEGNSAEIHKLKSIMLLPIDVTGIDRTKVEIYEMRGYLAGTGLSIREGTPTQVRVTVGVEREVVKEYSIPIDKIEVRGMQSGVSLQSGEADIRLEGIAAEIDDYVMNGILAYVDVTELNPGTYNLPVLTDLPEGIKLSGSDIIEVTIVSADGVSTSENTEDGETETNASLPLGGQ